MGQVLRKLSACDIASKLIYLNTPERETAINQLLHSQKEVRNWLKGYDNNELDIRKLLEKKHGTKY